MEFKGEVFNEAHKYKQGNTDTRGLKAVAVFRCLKCHADVYVTRILIGPRGLSFEILSVRAPRRALYHFATMAGLGSFLCPRNFFLSVH